jgi:hypothetical protein
MVGIPSRGRAGGRNSNRGREGAKTPEPTKTPEALENTAHNARCRACIKSQVSPSSAMLCEFQCYVVKFSGVL